jgi:outer membrane lipase/esterase
MKQFALRVALLALAALLPGPAWAAGFNQFVGLGDSTIDTGFFRYNGLGDPTVDQDLAFAIANGAQGGWAGNGVMGATILADKFGLSAAPYGAPGGGTNYANGAGFSAAPGPAPTSISTVAQIQLYLSSVNNVANPNALYVVSSGNNDLLKGQDLTYAASAVATAVAQLQTAGARTILVPNSFLGAVYAGPGGVIPAGNQAAYSQSLAYNTLRWSNLADNGVRFIPADLNSVFMYVVQHPTAFGFTANSVLSDQAPVYNQPSPWNTALLANDTDITQAQHQTYLFIDGHHLTTAGQTIQADYEYSLLVAPSQVSLLAESVLMGGFRRAAMIQGQLDPWGRAIGPRGWNVWTGAASAGTRFSGSSGFAGADGAPVDGAIGADFRTSSDLLFGAAFIGSGQRQDFSTGGHFDETDLATSFYAAYTGEPLWGDAVLTWNVFRDDVTRVVPLGILTDENRGSPSGQSLALALRGGRRFSFGALDTGPVVGLLMQHIHVGGFTETGATGLTNLSFSSQDWDSVVGQLGWRACLDLGRWRPFAQMEWDHEFAGRDRQVTAALTTVDAPAYAMAAAAEASDWSTLSLGSYFRINDAIVLRGSASTIFINPQMISCGGALTLNMGY